MNLDELRRRLDDVKPAEAWLRTWGVADPAQAHAVLVRIAEFGVTLDLMGVVCEQLGETLPRLSDPDLALGSLERFFGVARSPLSLAALFERDRDALPTLLQIFSSSRHLSDLLVADNESYDLLRLTEGSPVQREMLIGELRAEVDSLADEASVMTALRRFKRRETLRISYGDIIRNQRLEVVTAQISYLADAVIDAAVRFARRRLEVKRGIPRRADGKPARFVVLAMGKLGGNELNYSSDVDLVFLYDVDGKTEARRGPLPLGTPASETGPPRLSTNTEFFERLAQDVTRLLTESTPLGIAYRVDLRLRPEGERGPLVRNLESAMQYYDVLGRTWERQAYVKARPCAGDVDLGREFLTYLESWIYRRYLGLADITGIKALKRRIEQRVIREGHDARNVKTGRGGIRDVEFVIQFLQLLNGGDLPKVRVSGTLEALAQLEACGCLTHQERTFLAENYAFFRKIEHRLQIMFDLQTHLVPNDPVELRRLAIRLGYLDTPERTALEAFEAEYRERSDVNRKILDHLLHDAFGEDAETEPEVDLVLDPDPPPEKIAEVLAKYRFRDPQQAYRNLDSLAVERIRFLSTRRCRHFLASIAPRLLKAVAAMPDPDSTLVNLAHVSDSLGGKGVLWELFSFNPPSMKLYVELCASSPYLSGILVGNPGMIDELMDGLVLNKLPTRFDLRDHLEELCAGAEDLEPILHSFKNAGLLRIGVRDILGKDDVRQIGSVLTDLAETCLTRIVRWEYERLVEKLGEPTIGETNEAAGLTAGAPCGFALVALGKLGARELTYRSDLDLVFLYQADGPTVIRRPRRGEPTTNQHFFGELGQRIIKVASYLGQYGRLYEVDPRLRPTGRSGPLATSFAEFARYYAEGQAGVWERQSLCRARTVYGDKRTAVEALEVVHRAAFDHVWKPEDVAAIGEMRRRLEIDATPENLKRAPGTALDVEFLVQMLQLRYAGNDPSLRVPNTAAAMGALYAAGRMTAADYEFFTAGYGFLRALKSRLRLLSLTARNDLPTDAIELAKLARSLDYGDPEELLSDYRRHTLRIRQRYDQLMAEQTELAPG
ncbi:MAG: bifunctional [glutamate--ammonia ligase]-adenylyl-L-tyrosine phosphorylase/[glutamate--ammonia-ligase] adenylyltransferase [Planctomycetia bacterium]|nr:bifunctional [glutamate--ammonia ligase]-adenylyl-L-tyrosine phosphorylase/[glutamate--ammonia-ligase] adenylyltransferase [Planctomycetia bacterium]